MDTHRIEKRIDLAAPLPKVWRALTDAQEFGTWFGVKLEGPFVPGAWVRGRITHPGYEHVVLEVLVERMDEGRLFSYRWHPYAVEKGVDYSAEPTTLVEFHLQEVPGGTRLTVIESGFERIPLARRAEAFRMNEGGWAEQVKRIEAHVAC